MIKINLLPLDRQKREFPLVEIIPFVNLCILRLDLDYVGL
jgi:hypothetical protein